jgi:hypothetical protein
MGRMMHQYSCGSGDVLRSVHGPWSVQLTAALVMQGSCLLRVVYPIPEENRRGFSLIGRALQPEARRFPISDGLLYSVIS